MRSVAPNVVLLLQVRLDELCFVGDRLLTDVVFGNLHGMLTVHTRPLTLEGDNRPAAVFRFLERKVGQTDSAVPPPLASGGLACLEAGWPFLQSP